MQLADLLLVEDDNATNLSISRRLQKQGHQVRCANDGKLGWQLFQQRIPELLITDIIMPDEDGLALLWNILNTHTKFPCKVLVISGCSGSSGYNYLETASKLGCHGIFKKPIDITAFLNKIDELTGQINLSD